MVRVFVLYEQEPAPARYERHIELCRKVPNAVFRHGRVTRTLLGNEVAYYAEFEFPDRDTFTTDRKSTRLNSSHIEPTRMPSSA